MKSEKIILERHIVLDKLRCLMQGYEAWRYKNTAFSYAHIGAIQIQLELLGIDVNAPVFVERQSLWPWSHPEKVELDYFERMLHLANQVLRG